MAEDIPVLPVPGVTDLAARSKVTLVVIKSAGSAIVSTLMGVNWDEMSHQQQFMAVVAIVVNVATALEALYDRTMSTRAAGKAAAAGGTAAPFPTRAAAPAVGG